MHSPFRAFAFLVPLFGGPQSARWIHHVVMWLLWGFVAHHVYSAILMSQIEGNATMESIFSGYKFVQRDDVVYSGYRFFRQVEAPMTEKTPLLVLGLGNLLCGDDGLGAAAIARLDRRLGGARGRARAGRRNARTLAASLRRGRRSTCILVDAIRDDAPPGSLVRLTGEDVAPAVLHRLSPHQVGVADLLDGARLHDRYPRRLVLLGLVPQTLGLGAERSPAVESRLPDLVDQVVAEALAWGTCSHRRTNR